MAKEQKQAKDLPKLPQAAPGSSSKLGRAVKQAAKAMRGSASSRSRN